jgi:hypothetical protein
VIGWTEEQIDFSKYIGCGMVHHSPTQLGSGENLKCRGNADTPGRLLQQKKNGRRNSKKTSKVVERFAENITLRNSAYEVGWETAG